MERLQGLSDSGGIAFKGPAIFANLLLTPDDIRGLKDDPKQSPGSRDPRIVTEWIVSPPTPARTTRSPMSSDIPASHTWKRFVTESDGLANMSRDLVRLQRQRWSGSKHMFAATTLEPRMSN